MKQALINLIYAAQGGNATNDTPYMLHWLADRLVYQHGEDPKVDYIRAAHERARMLQAGLKEARDVRYQGVHGFGAAFRDLGTRLLDRCIAPFQHRAQDWLTDIVRDDPTDLAERRARFIEEALELVQALDMTESDVMQVVGYVFNRPAGVAPQEFGGTLCTLAVLADYTGYDLAECGEDELERVSDPDVMDRIRRKRLTRHGRGPLPGTSPTETDTIPPAGRVGDVLGNGQASEKLVVGSITAESIPSGAALVEERARLVAENEAVPSHWLASRVRRERIAFINSELARRG